MTDSAQRPGWYPDPDGVPGERWWNGVAWSDTRRGGPNRTVVPTAPAAPVAPLPTLSRPSASAPGLPPVPPPAINPYATAPRPVGGGANPLALGGFILSIASMFFLSFLVIPSVVATVLSLRGMARGRELRAQGNPGHQYGLAVAGFALGIAGTLFGAFGAVVYLLVLAGIER